MTMSESKVSIHRALISVSDKTGLDKLGRALAELNIEILSSGGTAKYLQDQGIPVIEISDFTGAPEMLDGRLKTLHPKVHGGILAVRDNPKHMDQLKSQDYKPIDLVVVNLYPFEETIQKEGVSFGEVIEKIDIGGPTLLRAAAKNWAFVTTLVEPSQYEPFLAELSENQGQVSSAFRKQACRRVFERTTAYDSAISSYFQKDDEEIPEHYSLGLQRKWSMRYGENPHQKAGFYLPTKAFGQTVLEKVLQGKQLSYNNLLDVHGATDLICDLPADYSVAILKHTNPCGVGHSETSLLEAYERALSCDPVSAFGGIVVFSNPVDGETAKVCNKTFTEIVIAPSFSAEAREVFKKKKNLRLLEIDLTAVRKALGGYDIRRSADGYLIQERDRHNDILSEAEIKTTRRPTEKELNALSLGWKVVKHVKSNAIVFSTENQTVGIGAGQMSRVDSSKIAAMKANPDLLKGSVLASDAFFPFRDSIDEAAKHGITAIVQPGGSIRDEEVIQACNEHDIAMLFTGHRHFKH